MEKQHFLVILIGYGAIVVASLLIPEIDSSIPQEVEILESVQLDNEGPGKSRTVIWISYFILIFSLFGYISMFSFKSIGRYFFLASLILPIILDPIILRPWLIKTWDDRLTGSIIDVIAWLIIGLVFFGPAKDLYTRGIRGTLDDN